MPKIRKTLSSIVFEKEKSNDKYSEPIEPVKILEEASLLDLLTRLNKVLIKISEASAEFRSITNELTDLVIPPDEEMPF